MVGYPHWQLPQPVALQLPVSPEKHDVVRTANNTMNSGNFSELLAVGLLQLVPSSMGSHASVARLRL